MTFVIDLYKPASISLVILTNTSNFCLIVADIKCPKDNISGKTTGTGFYSGIYNRTPDSFKKLESLDWGIVVPRRASQLQPCPIQN